MDLERPGSTCELRPGNAGRAAHIGAFAPKRKEACGRTLLLAFSSQSWHSTVVTITLDIPDELKARVDAIAARSNLSASQVIADALENGHSLEWQERFLAKVAAGLADADQGDFATDAEVDAVVNKYRPA